MRLPFKEPDNFSMNINDVLKVIQENYFSLLKNVLHIKKVKVMLGDGTITETETFDLKNVNEIYNLFLIHLSKEKWTINDILHSETEDLHRVYVQVSKQVNKFYIYGYFGIQYHVLPYYKVDKRIIEIQKELIALNEKQAIYEGDLSRKGNEVIKKELDDVGYSYLKFEELLSQMFNDQELMLKLENKASQVKENFPVLKDMNKTRTKLVKELDDMIIKLYRINISMIDYNKLIQGEEGIISYFEMETIKNKKKDPFVNTKRIDDKNSMEIIREFIIVKNTLSNLIDIRA
ncbi:MAG: hypothetical protein ACPKQO_09095 [Nitrososphaeraceae archaeon]